METSTRVLAALAIGLVLAACGSSTGKRPAVTQRDAARKPLPLPEEPLELIAAGAQAIGRIDLERVRESPHFASLRSWVLRYACATSESSHFLVHRTQRLAFASYAEGPSGQAHRAVVVLRGQYGEEDVARALVTSPWLSGAERGAPTKRSHGRFTMLSDGVAAAALLSPELLVVGHDAQVQNVLRIASGEGANWLREPLLLAGLDARTWLPAHTVALLSRLDERTARRLGRMLGEVGGSKLATGLERSAAALSMVFSQNARAELRVSYEDPAQAGVSAAGLRSVLSRAGFVLRLLGFGPLLQRLAITAEGAELRLALELAPDDLHDLLDRIGALLESEAPACPNATIALASEPCAGS